MVHDGCLFQAPGGEKDKEVHVLPKRMLPRTAHHTCVYNVMARVWSCGQMAAGEVGKSLDSRQPWVLLEIRGWQEQILGITSSL